MKKIIQGIRYDTDKATLIGEASADCPMNDFGYWEAALYRAPRSGRHFLAGSGGPMSRYGRGGMGAGGNETHGGDRIDPMTKEEAMRWAEEYLYPEEVEEHFGDMIEEA